GGVSNRVLPRAGGRVACGGSLRRRTRIGPKRLGESGATPMRLLLTHGFFLAEDLKEQQILRPYPPLGILYISAYLSSRGFDVDVYDSTWGSSEELFRVLDAGPPAVLGLYANLLTRSNALAIIQRAQVNGWKVI